MEWNSPLPIIMLWDSSIPIYENEHYIRVEAIFLQQQTAQCSAMQLTSVSSADGWMRRNEMNGN